MPKDELRLNLTIPNSALDPRIVYIDTSILEDLENASPYFCTFRAI